MNQSNQVSVYRLTRIAVVAAIYIVFTLAIAPLSYGAIQFRFSEILVLLCFYKKDYLYSMLIGCAIANLFSPFALYDVIFGTLATALAIICMRKCRRLWTASLFPTIGCIIIGLEITLLANTPQTLSTFLITTATVMIGEFIVVTCIGVPVFMALEKHTEFMKFMKSERVTPGSL